jgi:hypothetical protein
MKSTTSHYSSSQPPKPFGNEDHDLGALEVFCLHGLHQPPIIELTSNLVEDMIGVSGTDATNQGKEMRLDF